MMKQSFADQLKGQSDVWKSQVKDYQERMEQMSDKAREDYKKAIEQMEAKAEEARNMAEKVRGANEAAQVGHRHDIFEIPERQAGEVRPRGSRAEFHSCPSQPRR